MKLLFIGQAPGKPRFEGDAPGRAFNPIFSASGRRLASFTGYDFMMKNEFVNLFNDWTGRDDSCNPKGDAFPLAAAKIRANAVAATLHGRTVILVGENVASAFGLRAPLFFAWRGGDGSVIPACCWFTVVPHPSGVNRWWNAPTNNGRAKKFFRKLSKENSL